MKIYILTGDVDKYKTVGTIDSLSKKTKKEQSELLDMMRGQSLKNVWEKIKFEVGIDDSIESQYTIKEQKARPLGDFPNHPGPPIVSTQAMKLLKPFVENNTEFLEIEIINEGVYYIMNVTSVIDCLDKKKSRIEYFDSEQKRIMDIEKYSFFEKKLKDIYAFRILGYEKTIYVTDEFKKIVEKNNLEGFVFKDTAEIDGSSFDIFKTF